MIGAGGLINFLLDGFDVDVSMLEGQFLSAFGASAVKALDDFVWRGQFDAFIEYGATFLTGHSLRHLTRSLLRLIAEYKNIETNKFTCAN